MSSSSDAGYSTDEDRTVEPNVQHRAVRRGGRFRARFCIVQSYVKWGLHVNLCMNCYITRFGGLNDVNFIQTHFTLGYNRAMQNHSRCSDCRERLFTVFHQQSCIICNRM